MDGSKPTLTQINSVLDCVYKWSSDQGYRGYNKHDGLNSPILATLFGWGKWPRIGAIQIVMRAPVNLRPILLVPKTYNPKGLALFAQGLFDRYRITGASKYLAEAELLLGLLSDLKSRGPWSGDCWGYQYSWRDPGFFAPSGMPNAVVTSFVCEALLDGYRLTEKPSYLESVGSAIEFFLKDLTVLKDSTDELCLSYMPLPMTMRVIDVSILVSAIIAQYTALSGDQRHRNEARRLCNYVVNQQTNYGAWFYTDPPGDSLIRHDNYHTGFILDALCRYMDASGDTQWVEQYQQGLEFYATRLFNSEGSPRWMSDQDYPHDIHGAAQGILTFCEGRAKDRYLSKALQIVSWVLDKMYSPEGRFYYQDTGYFRRKFTLLRWCNAWMARSLSKLSLVLSAERHT